MATSSYMSGRKKYQRPQAMLWSENPGIISPDGKLIPDGLEIGVDPIIAVDENSYNQFLILSDDNRTPLEFKPIRIEKRERMINGRMRSYHIADKLTLATSWTMLPSRAYSSYPNFGENGTSLMHNKNNLEYTTDGGAGGVDILNWYETHKGPFWVFLSYDKRTNFNSQEDPYAHLPEYSQVIEMFISDFNYSVQKRGGTNHDFWDVSLTLEEV